MKRFFVVVLFLLLSVVGFSQTLELVGYARKSMKAVPGTKVVLKKDGKVVDEQTVPSNGRFVGRSKCHDGKSENGIESLR